MQNKKAKEVLKTIIQWDVKNWSKALEYWDKNANIKSEMKVLALGEREGGLSLYFAQKGCSVICSDYNPLPETTKKMHQEHKLDQRISYASIDMKAIDFVDEEFDIVVFKSVIGALGNKEDQLRSIHEIHRVLKPGGQFLFAENAKGSKLHSYLRKKFINWGTRWRYIPISELGKWKSIFSSSTHSSFGFHALFGRNERQRSILGSWDSLTNSLTPKSWRYIIFGVFTK